MCSYGGFQGIKLTKYSPVNDDLGQLHAESELPCCMSGYNQRQQCSSFQYDDERFL